MTTPVATVPGHADVASAARQMREHGVSWMPVTGEDGLVVGVLGRSDVLSVFPRPDASIRAEAAEEVLGRMLLVDTTAVDVGVRDGIVTSTGQLETRGRIEPAVSFTERVEGVVAVVDRLTYRVAERLADAATGPFY